MIKNFQISYITVLKSTLFIFIVFFGTLSVAQNKTPENYVRFVDSSNTYSNANPKLAAIYLDSIPEPVTKTIKGHLARYYLEKAYNAVWLNNISDIHKFYTLAIKYGELEKEYDTAGIASIGLFSQIYFAKKDTSALPYLEKARDFFVRSNNTLQLLEVNQMPAYMKFINNEFQASNDLIFKELEASKAVVDEDGYYYLFALYLIVTNYLHTDNIEKANTYYSDFKKLKENPTVDIGLYKYHDSNIQMCFVHYYFDKKENDSTLYYLAKVSKQRNELSHDVTKDFYRQYAETYKRINDLEASNVYLDSLILLSNETIDKTIKSNYSTREELIDIENELLNENKKSNTNKLLVYVFGTVLFLFLVFVMVRYKKIKERLKAKKNQIDDLSYLKTNHEKLKIKTQGLEAYITELKEQIKIIATVDTNEGQRTQIKDLYKNIQLKSSDILDEGKTHYEIINELNADFFKELKTKYPELSDSEIIICYYLCIGFKNKEIGTFLNRSTRSIESKRYRISKKIGLSKDTETLLEHLNELFKSFNLSIENKA